MILVILNLIFDHNSDRWETARTAVQLKCEKVQCFDWLISLHRKHHQRLCFHSVIYLKPAIYRQSIISYSILKKKQIIFVICQSHYALFTKQCAVKHSQKTHNPSLNGSGWSPCSGGGVYANECPTVTSHASVGKYVIFTA